MKVLEGDEKKEYEQFCKFHLDMRKQDIDWEQKPPKGFDKW